MRLRSYLMSAFESLADRLCSFRWCCVTYNGRNKALGGGSCEGFYINMF